MLSTLLLGLPTAEHSSYKVRARERERANPGDNICIFVFFSYFFHFFVSFFFCVFVSCPSQCIFLLFVFALLKVKTQDTNKVKVSGMKENGGFRSFKIIT